MTRMKHAAKAVIVLTMALCFALSAGIVWASSSEETGHAQAVVEQGAAEHGAVAAEHGEATAEHGEAAAGEHHGGSLSKAKLMDLFWRVLNFAVLVVILVKFGAKPIANGLSGRQKAITEEIQGLEARRDAAEASYKEFTAKLASVEKDIDTIVERAVAQAEIEKAKIIENAEKAAADIQRQAEMAIQNEITVARRNLKNEIADGAAVMAEELIVKNLTDEDQVKIIEDYLSKVGAAQ